MINNYFIIRIYDIFKISFIVILKCKNYREKT